MDNTNTKISNTEALKQMVQAYGRLHDILSDTIESGRLSESDIPDDYQAIVEQLTGPCCRAIHLAENTIIQENARNTETPKRPAI